MEELRERVMDKAVGMVAMLTNKLRELNRDLDAVTDDSLISRTDIELCIRGTQRELEVWQYIKTKAYGG
jgi:hypothetical protein